MALDGETWAPFGGPFRLTFGRWRGDRLGFCWNDAGDARYIDIDWFRYQHDGPLGGMGEARPGGGQRPPKWVPQRAP